MATSEEKQELVETIKRPVRYYRISLWGYGGESAYIGLTKQAYDFWNQHVKEHGDSDLVNYLVCAEDEDFDFEELEQVPPEANFLSDDEEGEGACSSWYEAPNEFEHQYGVAYDAARITIEELDGTEYSSKVLGEIVSGDDLSEFTNSNVDQIHEETGEWVELVEMGVSQGSDEQPDYVLQMYSAEKGTFFDGVIETNAPFNIKKLKIYTEEFPNGEDVVTSITYDGEEVDNNGGDTNGKGYSAHLWAN